MDWKTLESLGFECSGGAIDRENVCYGRMTREGPMLTDEGQKLAEWLLVPIPAEGPTKARKTKATTTV